MLKLFKGSEYKSLMEKYEAMEAEGRVRYGGFAPDELYTLCATESVKRYDRAISAAVFYYPEYEKFHCMQVEYFLKEALVEKAVRSAKAFRRRFRESVEANKKMALANIASGERFDGMRYFDYSVLLIRNAVIRGKYHVDDDNSIEFCDIDGICMENGKKTVLKRAVTDFIYEMIYATSLSDDDETFDLMLEMKERQDWA